MKKSKKEGRVNECDGYVFLHIVSTLQAAKNDFNFNRKIPLGRTWGSATAPWLAGDEECGWELMGGHERGVKDGWMEQVEKEMCFGQTPPG